MIKAFSDKLELKKYISSLKKEEITIGFVPTMGALHQGHLSLVKKALDENDLVVVSIFVNPTQFDNQEDLKKYPRTTKEDIKLLGTVSKEIVVYAPTVEDIYDKKVKSEFFDFEGLENEMEGKFRSGHFDGVGTVVKRLFDIVKPDRAYFGEKDYQQLLIIKKLASKHKLPVKVIGCKIMREKDGLAMSSRNKRLSSTHRKAAPFIYKTLKTAKVKFGTKSANYVTKWVEKEFAKSDLLELEYFIIANSKNLKTIKGKTKKTRYRAFIAVYAGEIRLIDNIALN